MNRGNVTWLSSLERKQQLERNVRLSLYPKLSTFSTSPRHDTDFTWSLVHHTIFDKLLGKRSTFACFWSLEPLLRYSMIFPLADQISVYKTLSNNSSQSLSKLLTSSAKCGLKGANVQKNRVADTAVKRKSMRNALVPGRWPRKFPALIFHWNQCRTGVSGKNKSTSVINLLKWSEVLQTEGFCFNSW